MGFIRRQVVTAALTANAIKPVPFAYSSIPTFFAGWLTNELAPQVLALTAADAATHARGERRDVRGLALAGLSAAGLAYLIKTSREVQHGVEQSLVDGLGAEYAEQLDALPTPAELATPWRKVAYPFRMRDKVRVRFDRNIRYADHGTRGLLDVYSPAEPVENAPVLLHVHGGGWTIGNKEQQGLQLMNHLAAKGWVCVTINYRLSPRSAFPDHIVDVKRALAWIKEHITEYGGDPDYVAITGGSAGGHLTALAALTPNYAPWQPGFEDADTSVQVAVPHYGVYDFTGSGGRRADKVFRDFLERIVMKKSYAEDPDAFREASPLFRVTEDAPDMFLIHGTDDSLVPVRQARELVAELRRTSKRTVTYSELPHTQHAFDVFTSIRSAHVVRAIDRYLHWHWNGYRQTRAVSR